MQCKRDTHSVASLMKYLVWILSAISHVTTTGDEGLNSRIFMEDRCDTQNVPNSGTLDCSIDRTDNTQRNAENIEEVLKKLPMTSCEVSERYRESSRIYDEKDLSEMKQNDSIKKIDRLCSDDVLKQPSTSVPCSISKDVLQQALSSSPNGEEREELLERFNESLSKNGVTPIRLGTLKRWLPKSKKNRDLVGDKDGSKDFTIQTETVQENALGRAGVSALSFEEQRAIQILAARKALRFCRSSEAAAMRKQIIASLPFKDRSYSRDELFKMFLEEWEKRSVEKPCGFRTFEGLLLKLRRAPTSDEDASLRGEKKSVDGPQIGGEEEQSYQHHSNESDCGCYPTTTDPTGFDGEQVPGDSMPKSRSKRGSISEAHRSFAREVVARAEASKDGGEFGLETILRHEFEQAGLSALSYLTLKSLLREAKEDLGLCSLSVTEALRREIFASLPFCDPSITRYELYNRFLEKWKQKSDRKPCSFGMFEKHVNKFRGDPRKLEGFFYFRASRLKKNFVQSEENTTVNAQDVYPNAETGEGPYFKSHFGRISQAHKNLARKVVSQGGACDFSFSRMVSVLQNEVEKEGLRALTVYSLKNLVSATTKDLRFPKKYRLKAALKKLISSLPWQDPSMSSEELYHAFTEELKKRSDHLEPCEFGSFDAYLNKLRTKPSKKGKRFLGNETAGQASDVGQAEGSRSISISHDQGSQRLEDYPTVDYGGFEGDIWAELSRFSHQEESEGWNWNDLYRPASSSNSGGSDNSCLSNVEELRDRIIFKELVDWLHRQGSNFCGNPGLEPLHARIMDCFKQAQLPAMSLIMLERKVNDFLKDATSFVGNPATQEMEEVEDGYQDITDCREFFANLFSEDGESVADAYNDSPHPQLSISTWPQDSREKKRKYSFQPHETSDQSERHDLSRIDDEDGTFLNVAQQEARGARDSRNVAISECGNPEEVAQEIEVNEFHGERDFSFFDDFELAELDSYLDTEQID